MVSPLPREPIPFDRSAAYKITVYGKIDPTWSDRLEGMRIGQRKMETGQTITTLDGDLSDQAALTGVLNMLYELHLTVVSVERLEK